MVREKKNTQNDPFVLLTSKSVQSFSTLVNLPVSVQIIGTIKIGSMFTKNR